MQTSTVYLIHFDKKYRHAGHYLGSAIDLQKRIAHHRNNTGARLLEVINNAGIGWSVVRTWKVTDGTGRTLERKLKNWKKASQLCPCCNPKVQA